MPAPAPGSSPAPLPAPPARPRRLVYLGSPAMAVPPLEALVAAGFDVALVVTRADKRRGRRGGATPTPVAAAATRLGVPVSHDPADAAEAGADAGVVVAYGRILRRPLLEALPMVNLHFSLLPRWRGAAPVERALLAGDARTGVCVMAVEETLDTGGVYARAEVPIGPRDTAGELAERLTEEGAALLVHALQGGLGDPEPQHGEATYAEKLTAEDRHLRWDRPAAELDRVVRVGGAWTTFRDRRLKVAAARLVAAPVTGAPGTLEGAVVATGDGGVELVTVQPEGKAPMAAADWLHGARPEVGERLGEASGS